MRAQRYLRSQQPAVSSAGPDPDPAIRTEEQTTDATSKARIAANAAHDKKGEDILVLEVGSIMGIVEHFVVTSASNTRQVRTIVDEVDKQMRARAGLKPRATEGVTDASWVLVDYGDVVVHVFLTETREFYGLERLWADAPRVALEGVGAP
jgi:ribosome-associated protein